MAVANFFDRSLLSASQALRGIAPAAIQQRLETIVVELAFDDHAAVAAEGRIALDLAVRLLARLYPTLRIIGPSNPALPLTAELEELAKAINPEIEISLTGEADVRLIFGATTAEAGTQVIYAGSDGWLAKVSKVGPQGCGTTDLPFGAGAAACLGAANVFRAIFSDWLEAPQLDEAAVLSLLDFSTGASAAQGPGAIEVDIGATPLVGLGAIGNGVIWALSRTRGVSGALHLVDHETVELSNLQRYVLATQEDDQQLKVAVAQQALAAGGFEAEVLPFACRWDEYLQGQGHPVLGRVVAALDSAEDRIAVQASLPRRTLNAWTQAGDLGVSRHGFNDSDACLTCLYLPTGTKPNQDVIIAEALKLPTEPQNLLHPLRELLVNGQPVGDQFVRDAAHRLGLPEEALLPFAGEPLMQFYVKAVCGGVILDGRLDKPPLEAPLAFQSALAGIMLAAELIADAGGMRRDAMKTKTILDLKRALPKRLNFRIAKRDATTQSKCICQDPDFVSAYVAKHLTAEPRPADHS
ncbi:MAG TPA: E2 ligase fold family C protein [Allosphingosinicella sp.]|nr:E2 ligase fold family C protein [Allosphingosinicella sp.]